jgi:hypothetical protein
MGDMPGPATVQLWLSEVKGTSTPLFLLQADCVLKLYACVSPPCRAKQSQVRKDHLMLALEKSESDRMQQEVRLAPAAALVSWRLDQSVRDTTARRQLDAIRRLSQPTTDSPFEALLRMVRRLAWRLPAQTQGLSQHRAD